MKRDDYTLEYCPWCDSEAAIHAHGVTPCPFCGKPLAPCSVCIDESGGCKRGIACPYGCTGGPEDEFKQVTAPPMTQEELDFAYKNL